MKKTLKTTLGALLALVLCIGICACGNAVQENDLWANATYTEDTELGAGAKTVTVEVTAEEKTVVFTLHTDAQTVGEALMEHNLVSGEQSAYGLYIKSVNGIEADYSKTQTYWGFNKDGASMQTGVDGAQLSDGEHYELVYTK